MQGFLSFSVSSWTGGKPSSYVISMVQRDGTFPGGLLPILLAGARTDGVRVEVIDRRVAPCGVDRAADLSWLRPYQREALEAIATNVRGTVKIATGGGKGELVAALPRFIPARWTLIVHRTHLMEELADRFEKRTGEEAGRVGDGKWTHRRVTFVTFATLAARAGSEEAARLFQTTQGLIVDEVHTAPALTHGQTLAKFRNAYWRVGLSASPFARGDRKSILAAAYLGPMIYELSATDLIDMGSLAKPSIRMVACNHDEGTHGLPWPALYQHAVVHNLWRNTLVVRTLVRSPGPRMVFVNDLEHGRILTRMATAAGLRCRFVEGASSLDERKQIIADLAQGKLDAAVATGVFNEGVDIPCLRTVVIASGGKAYIAAVQRVGRATRLDAASGKTTADVWDFDDRGHPNLAAHSRARRRAYTREGYAVQVQETPVFDAPEASAQLDLGDLFRP